MDPSQHRPQTAPSADSYIPVGTVINYAVPTEFGIPLPSNWTVCDGRQMNAKDYPDLYNALQNSNGPPGPSGTFNLPNLQGSFIRGSGKLNPGTVTKFQTGQAESSAQKTNPIKVTLQQIPVTSNNAYKVVIGGTPMNNWQDGSTIFTPNTGDRETRPVNIAMVFIIKLAYNSQVGPDDVPLGSVIPAAFQQNFSPDSPSWIKCDGSQVPTSQVPDLQKVTQGRFQAPPYNPSVFVAPNISGKFVRGEDLKGFNDPDFAARQPAPNQAHMGVGTWQQYGTAFKNPSVKVNHYAPNTTNVDKVKGYNNLHNDHFSTSNVWSGGATESRPINIAMNFYISSATQNQVFPIGGIIAIPGNPKVTSEWLECAGDSLSQDTYRSLFLAIGTTWGSQSHDTFNIPNLQNMFIRAADTSSTGAANGDMDRNTRMPSGKGGSHSGPGSSQPWTTALPITPMNINIKYATDVVDNAGGDNVLISQINGPESFPLLASWDAETAPVNVAVRFYIKAQ